MGLLSKLFKNEKEIIEILEEDMRAHRALSQQYQKELSKALAERDEALKYKDLNMGLLEELRLSQERLDKAELESSAWEARYYNEFAEHELTKTGRPENAKIKQPKTKTKRKAK